ncbi:MAG: hypothetical protein WC325_11410 [Candidatus Bathyarchaeia archaeon]|jgi:hypothetical protein
MDRTTDDIYMSNVLYLQALKNLRKHVEAVKFSAEDCTDVGNKHTHCSWGLCCDDLNVFTKEMMLFPKEYPKRHTPKYLQRSQKCPFDKAAHPDGGIGCFYRCRFHDKFNKRKPTEPNREEALKTIDELIKKVEESNG